MYIRKKKKKIRACMKNFYLILSKFISSTNITLKQFMFSQYSIQKISYFMLSNNFQIVIVTINIKDSRI